MTRVLQLFPVLFQSHFDQLSPSAHAEFVEQLAEGRLHSAFRDFQSRRNVLVGQAVKNETKHGFVPIGEPWVCLRSCLIHGSEQGRQVVLFDCRPPAPPLGESRCTAPPRVLLMRDSSYAGNVGGDACALLPVYDPSGGFVTGTGQVASPVEADLLNTSASGPAALGFVSKYLPGQSGLQAARGR